jgi:hypothetical protein
MLKFCLAAFAVGVLVEAKPLRLASRLLDLVKLLVQKVSQKLVAGSGKLDEVLDDKVGDDE